VREEEIAVTLLEPQITQVGQFDGSGTDDRLR